MENFSELNQIANKFFIQGEVTSVDRINKGYINTTYKVETLSKNNHVHKYILQRINTHVFPNVALLMNNFLLATEHLSKNLQMPGTNERGIVQTLRPTKDGKLYYEDESGTWRILTYFDNVYSLPFPKKVEEFYYAGVSFGAFIKAMSTMDVSKIQEVIPDFHNTKKRYYNLEDAISQDKIDRVKKVSAEIDFVRARVHIFGLIIDALESGKIPTRICHNDCNLNNILFDNDTNLPVTIIDLDTVMPSSPLYDYGSSMRAGAKKARDDEKDLSKVYCSLDLYEAYSRGYLESCGNVLTKDELELLPYAAIINTAEDAMRFLTDYLSGDVYYHIDYEEQNLDRARAHFKLVEDMEKKLPEIRRILQDIYNDLGLKANVLEK